MKKNPIVIRLRTLLTLADKTPLSPLSVLPLRPTDKEKI